MSTASSAQLSAVSRQVDQSRDLNRQQINTLRWEVQKIKSIVERLQGLHGKVDACHLLLKQLIKHNIGQQPISSVDRFREQHSQTPPKSPTSSVSTQSITLHDQDELQFKPDADEHDDASSNCCPGEVPLGWDLELEEEEEFQPDEYELGKAEEEERARKEREEEEEETEL